MFSSSESIKKEGVSLCIMNNIMSAVSLDKQVEIFNNVRRFQSVLPSVHLSVVSKVFSVHLSPVCKVFSVHLSPVVYSVFTYLW